MKDFKYLASIIIFSSIVLSILLWLLTKPEILSISQIEINSVIGFAIGTYLLIIVPGILLVYGLNIYGNMLEDVNKVISIPVTAIIFWLFISLLSNVITHVHDIYIVFVGYLLILIIGLIKYRQNILKIVNTNLNSLYRDLRNNNILIILLLVPVAIALFLLIDAYKTNPYLANYDAQTHTYMIARIIQYKTMAFRVIAENEMGTGDGIQTYYPIGYHMIATLLNFFSKFEAWIAARNLIFIIIPLYPVLIFYFFNIITKNKSLSLLCAYFSIIFVWFPYMPMQWGGVPQIFGSILIPFIIGILYISIKKYGLFSLKTLVFVTMTIILALVVHPSILFTIVLIIAVLHYRILISEWKSIMILLIIGLILGIVLYFLVPNNMKGLLENLFGNEGTIRVSIKDWLYVLMKFHMIWFGQFYSILNLLFLFGIAIVITARHKLVRLLWRNDSKLLNISIKLLIALGISYIFYIITYTMGGIPVIGSIISLWYGNIGRINYLIHPLIIFFSVLPIYLIIYKLLSSRNVSKIEIMFILFIILAPIYLVVFNETRLAVNNFVKEYSMNRSEYEFYLKTRDIDKYGKLIALPSIQGITEDSIRWINPINPNIQTLLGRGSSGILNDELEKRRDLIRTIDSDLSSICKDNIKNNEFDVKYIIIRSYPIYPIDIKQGLVNPQVEYPKYKTVLDNLPCLKVLQSDDQASLYEII